MNRSLRRLLRIREVMEDRARLALERTSAHLRSLEQSAERQRQTTRQIRAAAVEDLTRQQAAAQEWRLKVIDAELAEIRQLRLERMAEAVKPVVDEAREELVERRRELRQAEILHAEAMDEEERQELRRDQSRTDDLIGNRLRMGRKG